MVHHKIIIHHKMIIHMANHKIIILMVNHKMIIHMVHQKMIINLAHLQIMVIHTLPLQSTIIIQILMALLKEEIIILIIINRIHKEVIHTDNKVDIHLIKIVSHLINLQELNLVEVLKIIMMIAT